MQKRPLGQKDTAMWPWIWVLRESSLSLLAIWSLKMRLRFIRKPYHMEPEREPIWC